MDSGILMIQDSILVCSPDPRIWLTALDVMALTHWEIETLQWTDGSKPKDNIGRGYRINVISLQDIVLSLHPSLISMTTNNWIVLTSDQFDKFQSSSHYRSLDHNAPRPEPPPVNIIKDGEQCCNLAAHDLFEFFDADEFEAAMICSIETSSGTNEEKTTTKDNGILKALENAIVFFETFCLMDDFEAHAMDDETNIPSTTAKPETINTMPFAANKDIEYPSHELAMKDTIVHIEYPDRTKFVSSMNHEQYEEMRTCIDLVVDASFFAKSCPLAI
jgi:hypothetical protein